MPQRQEKAKPPMMVERIWFFTKREAATQAMPTMSHTHQHCFPHLYSILMTAGWQIPMLRNTAAPRMIPLKFILFHLLFRGAKVGISPPRF